MTKTVSFALVIISALILSVGVATGAQQANANGSQNGEEVFLNRCSTCHGPERALVAPRTRKGWEAVTKEMVNNGMQLETGELEPMLAFLTERHGLVNVNAANAEELVALGLSKKDADTIVSYRTDHGPFADFAALHRVPGLDVDRLNAVRERVAFGD